MKTKTKTKTKTKAKTVRKPDKLSAGRTAELEMAPPTARAARDRASDPPAPIQLAPEQLYAVGAVGIMLTGPGWCYREDYERFVDAGGTVDTRGFAFELRERARS